MSHPEPELTPAVRNLILSFLRAGGYPHVAAEAAGVPGRVFEKWLRRGNRRRAQAPYLGFADEVRQAAAQARLRAEVAVFDKRPLDWLKCGPGKETSRWPGWSGAPKAATASLLRDDNPLASAAVQRLFADLLDAMTPHPDIRAELADKVPQMWQSRRRRRLDDEL